MNCKGTIQKLTEDVSKQSKQFMKTIHVQSIHGEYFFSVLRNSRLSIKNNSLTFFVLSTTIKKPEHWISISFDEEILDSLFNFAPL